MKLVAGVVAVLLAVLIASRRSKIVDREFAFEETFPDWPNAFEYTFQVVDPESSQLAAKEADLLEKLRLDPMYRCKSQLYGVRWSTDPSKGIKGYLRYIWNLVLEDVDPPSKDAFIVRHRIFGYMASRHDRFTCIGHNQDGVCTEWESVGYVPAPATWLLTRGASKETEYRQKFVLRSETTESLRCPL